jgi:hypothetical protein
MDNEATPLLAGPDMQAAIQAYQQLLKLNWDSWKPEVAEWLHSEDAAPVLKELLAAVPCPAVLH